MAYHRKLLFSPFLSLCALGFFAIFSSTMSKSPVLPLFADHLGATESMVGFIASASTIVGILVSLPAGVISDTLGRRKVITIAAVVFASSPYLYLLVTKAWQLVCVRVFHGLATAIFGPVALALVADLFEERRGESMGWYSSATLAGRSLAPIAGGFFLALFASSYFWHYRFVYVVCGLSGCTALLLVSRLPKKEELSFKADQDTPSYRRQILEMISGLSRVVKHRGILVTSTSEAIQYLGYGAYEVFFPLYVSRLGIPTSLIGILLGSHVIALTLTKPLMGMISDRYGRRLQIALGLMIGAIGIASIPFFKSFGPLLIISIVLGIQMSAVTASTGALVADMATSSSGSALGVMSTIMDVGHSLGPILMGMLIRISGYQTGYFTIGGVLFLTSVLFVVLAGGKKR